MPDEIYTGRQGPVKVPGSGVRRLRSAVFLGTLCTALVTSAGTAVHAAGGPAPVKSSPSVQPATGTGNSSAGSNGPGKAVIAPAPPAAAGGKADNADNPAEKSAVASAKATGKSVPVASETTQTTEVVANADGTLTDTVNVLPVRVQKDGVWTPISTNLSRNADGTYSPAAAATPESFSGGGNSTLLTMTDPKTGKTVSVSWPGTLPAPQVSGAAATYPGVLPGVDLWVEATSTGYSEVLVVHDAAAAANPKLRTLTFALHGGAGTKVTADSTGATSVTDTANNAEVFGGGAPVMWNSATTGPIKQTPTPDNVGSGQVTRIPVTASGSGTATVNLTLAPPASALDQPAQDYPLFIDPGQDGAVQYYSEVSSFGGVWNSTTKGTAQGSTSSVLEVGDCGYSSCQYEWNGVWHDGYVFEDFFQMNTSDLTIRNNARATMYSATFYADEIGNSNNCTAQPVSLYTAGPIGSGTTWSNKPLGSLIQSVSSAAGGGTGCPAADVDFNATSFMTTAAADGYPNTTFALRAPSETQELQYKTFSDNPTLSFTYNWAPLTPTGLSVSGAVTCTSTVYTSVPEPQLTATSVDGNPSGKLLPLNLWFEVWNNTATTRESWNTTGVQVNSGVPGHWTTNDNSSLPEYNEFRVQSSNIPGSSGGNALYSPWSAWYPFDDLSTGPSAAPTVSSYDYPQGAWGQPTGDLSTFTLGTNGAADIAGFAYDVDGNSKSEPVPNTADCSYLNDDGRGPHPDTTSNEVSLPSGSTTAQIRIPALAEGRHVLNVESFDLAHNPSGEFQYVFYVAPNYTGATQQVKQYDGDKLTAAGTGVGVQTGNCCGVTWDDGSQLMFSNSSATGSFTVQLPVPGPTGSNNIWSLGADMTTATDYGQFSVGISGQGITGTQNLGDTSGEPFDGYTPNVSLKYLDLGDLPLTGGQTYTLTFTAVGTNAASTGNKYNAGINYLLLEPTNRYEAESLPHSNPTAGSVYTQTWTSPLWSDNQQLMLADSTAPTPSAPVDYTVTVNVPQTSDYSVGAGVSQADDYGIVQFTLADPGSTPVPLGPQIDGYNSSVTSAYHSLGGVFLTAGQHTIEISVVGTDAASINNRYQAGVDYFELAPITPVQETSLTAAMNNQGIAQSDNATTTASLDLNASNLSRTALANAGITPGTATGSAGSYTGAAGNQFTLDNATFTMPAPQVYAATGAITADNVVAIGQTIPLQAVQADSVDFLVVCTNGDCNNGTFTVGYTAGGPTPAQETVSTVPDWCSAETVNVAGLAPGKTLPSRDKGTGATPDTTCPARLFVVSVPTNPLGTLASVTLPSGMQTFLPGSGIGVASLHVLAIGYTGVASGPPVGASPSIWVGSYAAPADSAITPPGGGYSDETVRESAALSVAGAGSVRIHLTNAHATAPVTFDAVTLGAQASTAPAATLAAPAPVYFNGSASVTIPAGGDVYSDPIALPATSGGTGRLTVSMHIQAGQTITSVPVHDTTTGVTFYVGGNQTTNNDGTVFSNAYSTLGLYYLAGIDVNDTTTTDGTIAILGDQTATPTAAGSWPANLASAVQGYTDADGVADILPGGVANDATSGPNRPLTWWKADSAGNPGAGTGTSVVDAAAADDPLALDGAAWSSANPGTGSSTGSLSFDGTSQYAATSGPVLDTSGSFTISAWAKLSSLSQTATVAAQEGANNCGFYLWYNTGWKGWAFSFASADSTTYTWNAAGSSATPTANTWYHLVGVYNASTQTAQLYVNGALAATGTGIANWNATGPLVVGASKQSGPLSTFFPGQISDVRTWNSALPATAVSAVYNDNGNGTLTAANALSAFEGDVTAEPDLRDVIVSVGTNDVLQGQSAAQIEANLTTLVRAVNNQKTNAGTAVEVYLATIAPLGLPASDPREQVRQAVNNAITGGQIYSAVNNTVFDFAGAVDDPSNVNNVNPTYLTGGMPNSTYYNVIDTLIATDITPDSGVFPPIGSPFVARRPAIARKM